MTYNDVTQAARAAGLIVMGALHPGRAQAKGLDSGTLILLGAGAEFWRVLTTSPEGQDAAPDPIDRWSVRVVTALAETTGAEPHFPFGGPPYAPFIDWAEKSGRAWPSPTGMLVHDTVGLMISYRGALHFADEFALPMTDGTSPCTTCVGRPCITACPVGALGIDAPYDVPACHAFLRTGPGADCMTQGCAVRRACPVSQRFGRDPAQSAHHMQAFHRS